MKTPFTFSGKWKPASQPVRTVSYSRDGNEENLPNQSPEKSEEEEKKKEKLEKYQKAADDYKRCKFKNIRQAALAYDLSYVTLYKVCYSYPWPFQKTNIT